MARKSMSVIDVMAWISGARGWLLGARVANVYDVGGRILLKFKGPKWGGLVVAEPAVRIHATERLTTAGARMTPIAAVLRKYVRGARLEGIEQLGNDRIVRLNFSNGYSIVVEMLPRGVIALLDSEGAIVAADKYLEMRDRVIKPRHQYKPPPGPQRSITEITPENLAEYLKGQRDLIRGLVRSAGLPGEAAEEAVYRAGLDPKTKPESLGTPDLEALAVVIKAIVDESLEARGYLARGEDILEATPFKPLRLEGRAEIKEYQLIDNALDELFALLAAFKPEDEAERARLLASLRKAEETERAYREEAERLRRLAEEAAANYQLLESVRECVLRAWETGGWKAVEGCDGISGTRPEKGLYIVRLPSGSEVEVQLKEEPSKLIVRLYAMAGEAEAKARRAAEAKSEILAKLEEVRERILARQAEQLALKRRRMWYEKYHWLITRNGFLAIGGRNAEQNESVVKKYLEERDIFMHADIHGAPAVVLKTGGREPSIEDLMDAAVVAAAYSRAWRAGLGSVSVYWVWGEQVSKSPPSGEYLARGAFMVYGKKNYLPPVPMRLSLGLALDDEGAPYVIIGPRDLVTARSLAYVTIVPGDRSVSELAELVKKSLYKALPPQARHLALGLPLRDIEERLPGKGRIIEAGRGSMVSLVMDK